MIRRGLNAKLWSLALLLAASCATGCSRLGAAGGEQKASSQEAKALPFHSDVTDHNAPGAASTPSSSEAGGGLLFASTSRRPRLLPSGTLVTVRLEHPLDSADVHAGDAFTAVVAEPVIIAGDTLIARDTTVTGAVEFAQESTASRSTGYVRLTLSTITIDGKRLPLQTSSLFAQGTVQPIEGRPGGETGSSSIRLPQGRRLTFRLTVPAVIDRKNAVADGQAFLPNGN